MTRIKVLNKINSVEREEEFLGKYLREQLEFCNNIWQIKYSRKNWKELVGLKWIAKMWKEPEEMNFKCGNWKDINSD